MNINMKIEYIVNLVSADLPKTRDRLRYALIEMLEAERERISGVVERQSGMCLETLEYLDNIKKTVSA